MSIPLGTQHGIALTRFEINKTEMCATNIVTTQGNNCCKPYHTRIIVHLITDRTARSQLKREGYQLLRCKLVLV